MAILPAPASASAHVSLAPGPANAPAASSALPPRVFTLLRWACVALFLGRAWQHLRWDAPYRALLWSQETMEPFVTGLFGVPWEIYATSPAVATAIAAGIKLVGVLHLACAFAAWRIAPAAAPAAAAPSRRTWAHALLLVGALSLVLLAFCSYRDRVYRIGEFFDLACQFTLPLLLAFSARGLLSASRVLAAIRVAVACTFAGHGLKALGLYPVPGEWITMTMLGTGLSETHAFRFLEFAGLLDFVVAAAVLLPWIRLDRAAFAYAAAWGLLTALARPAAFVRWDNLADGSAQWLHEAVMRLPHAALPLAALWLLARSAVPAPLPFALPRTHNIPSSTPNHT